MIGALWGSAVALAAPEGDCSNREEVLTEAEHAVVHLDVEAARAALEHADEAFGCGRVARVESVSRLLWAHAAQRVTVGDDVGAALTTGVAVQLGERPASYDSTLPAPPERAPAGDGSLDVFPVPRGHRVFVDGVRRALPAPLLAGPHVVQIARSRRVAWGRVVQVDPGIDLMVQTQLPLRMEHRRRRNPLVTGIGIGIGASALLLLASTIPTEVASRRAYDAEEFDLGDAWVRVNRGLLVGAGLGLAAGGGLIIAGEW